MVVTAELATKRLQSANGTQDGIETISTWMLHHTDSFRVLADCWLNLFRTEGEDRRVVLFYIMNDVVQRAKKKHVDSVCSIYEQPVISAVSLGRFSEKLRGVMSRCLKLIAECKAFSADGLLKMNRMIADPNGDADDGNYEIDVIDLAKKIEAFMKGVDTISKGYEVLKRSPQNLEEQIATRMKDRKEGAILLKETKTSILRLEKFGEAVTNNTKRLYEFVDAIETAKRLFNMQLRDVAVVEDAYVKFGQGVREVQEEVEEMLRTGVYPAGSPPRDAPSPSAEDDVFAAGVEQVLNKMRPHDLTDEADMEVDDDEPTPSQWEKKSTPTAPSRPSVLERAAALATHIPALANHMGIDPRSRANTLPAASSAAAAPAAKKPAIDSAALQQVFARAAATIPSLQQAQSVGGYPAAAAGGASTTAAPPTSFSVPPPLFAPNMPPPSPAIVAQFMAMQQQQQQQQQQQTASASAPLAVHTMHASVPSVPPPISPYSAPPPGYPTAGSAVPAAQQYMHQQQPAAHQQQQNRQQQQQSHYSPPSVNAYSGYGGTATTGGYQQPAAAASQQQYGTVQQGQKKYSTMPEYGRSNSNPGGSLQSPTGGATSGYYPMHNNPSTPAGSSAAVAGTPYTPTAPGLMGRKGSEGGGGYGRGGGQVYNAYGAGYGTPQEEQSEDAYRPQHVARQNSFGGQDSDFRQQQQNQRGGGTPRGYGRGNQGGYGRFQRGGQRGGRGGGGGGGGYGSQQQNYGGSYNNQGY